MNRRNFFRHVTQASGLAGVTFGGGRLSKGATPVAPAAPRLSSIRITKVKAILTAPARIRLCVVKVETSEPGLDGVGCATFTQRIRTVVTAVNEYLAPFLIGKDPGNIEDLWQAMYPNPTTCTSGWRRSTRSGW